MAVYSRILKEVASSLGESVALLSQLVQAPTVTGDMEAYQKAIRIMEIYLDARIERSVARAPGGGPNLVAKFGQGAPVLLLTGHMDVVPAGMRGWTEAEPFEGKVSGGRVYGRGAADMKAGIVAMLTAANIVSRLAERPKGSLLLAVTVDEETGGEKGLGYLVGEGLRADEAIVCEPTGLEVVVAFKAPLWLKIVTTGKSAHAGMPDQGVNAVQSMVRILNRLENWGGDLPRHTILGRPTLSIGTIRGGDRPNTVPDCCECTIDIRYLPSQTVVGVKASIESAINSVQNDDPSIVANVEIIRSRVPVELPEDSRLRRQIGISSLECLGRRPLSIGMPSPGDGEYLAKAGIPMLMFGPGKEEMCHVPNEWVEIEEMRMATLVYAHVALRLMGGL